MKNVVGYADHPAAMALTGLNAITVLERRTARNPKNTAL